MTAPVASYSGGIRTVACLMNRCHVDEDTGCWLWRLSISQGVPRVHILLPDGRHGVMRGRRAALYLARGIELQAGHVAFAAACCKRMDCCNPEHARSGTRIAAGKALSKSGRVRMLPRKVAAALRNIRLHSKLNPQKVRDIRASEMSTRDLSRLYGVAQSHIQSIRAGKAWRELAPNASVFSQRA